VRRGDIDADAGRSIYSRKRHRSEEGCTGRGDDKKKRMITQIGVRVTVRGRGCNGLGKSNMTELCSRKEEAEEREETNGKQQLTYAGPSSSDPQPHLEHSHYSLDPPNPILVLPKPLLSPNSPRSPKYSPSTQSSCATSIPPPHPPNRTIPLSRLLSFLNTEYLCRCQRITQLQPRVTN
jgi:hypothetical protein